MRFKTSGTLRRLDLTPVVALLPALRDEWAGLRFGPGGKLVNPLTGGTLPALTLVEGRHRQPGARYRVVLSSPTSGIAEEVSTGPDGELPASTSADAGPDGWAGLPARRRDAPVQVGTIAERHIVTLVRDDDEAIACSVAGDGNHWEVAVEVTHGAMPRIGLTGRVDLTAEVRAAGVPGCLAPLVGRTATATASIDAAALDRGGRLVGAEAGANRFRGGALLDVDPSITRWKVTGRASLTARGVARPVLWFTRRRIRAAVDGALSGFWASSEATMAGLERDLARLDEETSAGGGASPYLHRLLWDPATRTGDVDPAP